MMWPDRKQPNSVFVLFEILLFCLSCLWTCAPAEKNLLISAGPALLTGQSELKDAKAPLTPGFKHLDQSPEL